MFLQTNYKCIKVVVAPYKYNLVLLIIFRASSSKYIPMVVLLILSSSLDSVCLHFFLELSIQVDILTKLVRTIIHRPSMYIQVMIVQIVPKTCENGWKGYDHHCRGEGIQPLRRGHRIISNGGKWRPLIAFVTLTATRRCKGASGFAIKSF